jgi:tRNA splicing ligase
MDDAKRRAILTEALRDLRDTLNECLKDKALSPEEKEGFGYNLADVEELLKDLEVSQVNPLLGA